MGNIDLGVNSITVKSTAVNLQSIPLCVLQTMLDNKTGGAMLLNNTSKIMAPGCAIHSNGDINIKSGAYITADRIQAVGKVNGLTAPRGNSGAMPIEDPFIAMNLTPPTKCLGKKPPKTNSQGILTLAAGVHCEDIKIDNSGTLFLMPGEHYLEGEIELKNNATLKGNDVTLIFGNSLGNGEHAFSFADKATINLTARQTGRFAGFLIITSRTNTRTFSITSGNVRELLGTIYIPSASLAISTTGSVAQNSAWSVIVANRIVLTQNPVLVINNNYAGSKVPVPKGVGPTQRAPRLVG